MPIRSVNAPREVKPLDGAALNQGALPRPIETTAIPPVASSSAFTKFFPDHVVGMTEYGGKLFVATEFGIYWRTPDGIFERCIIRVVEEPNE